MQKSKTDRQKDANKALSLRPKEQTRVDRQRGGQAGSAKSVYLPAGRQGGVVKGGGGGGGQEEVEPEQGHS